MIELSGGFLDLAKKAVNDIEGLKFATLFGSLVVEGHSYHDIDVAIGVSGGDKYLVLCEVLESLSKALKVREEEIDIVDLDRADLAIKGEVVRSGLVLLDRTGYRMRLVEELNTRYTEYDEIESLNIREWTSSEDPSKINLRIAERRIDFARRETQFLKENVLNQGVDGVEGSPILKRLMERGLHLITEALLDVLRHIVSTMGWGPALSYSDLAEISFTNRVIDEGLKVEILNSVRLRNIKIHRYLEVDYRRLYKESGKLERIVRDFEKQVLRFIDSLGASN